RRRPPSFPTRRSSDLGDGESAGVGDGESASAAETRLTDVSADLRAAGLGRQIEIAATAPDGYPVHGWLVLPPGDGPHPVLLAVQDRKSTRLNSSHVKI